MEERHAAEKSPNNNSGKHRLDHILYEIAYIDYLCQVDLSSLFNRNNPQIFDLLMVPRPIWPTIL